MKAFTGKQCTYLAKFSTVVWQNSAQLFGKIHHSCLAKFSIFKGGETEQQIFHRALCVSNFVLGAESLVKSTLGQLKSDYIKRWYRDLLKKTFQKQICSYFK